MKNRQALMMMSIALFAFSSWNICLSQTPYQKKAEQKEIENYLRTAKIGGQKIRAGKRTESWQVSLDDGKTKRKGFYKVTNRTRPDFLPDSYKYGIAAYELNKLLDLYLILPTVEREIEGRKGSLMLFLEGCLKEGDRRRKKIEPPDMNSFNNTLEDIVVFENLTYSFSFCNQSNLDDILIMEKEDWKVWRVDFSEAFAPISELNPTCTITSCSKKLYQNLLGLDNKAVRTKLKPYLNDEEIKALSARKELIIKKIKKLIEERGEESVLFK